MEILDGESRDPYISWLMKHSRYSCLGISSSIEKKRIHRQGQVVTAQQQVVTAQQQQKQSKKLKEDYPPWN